MSTTSKRITASVMQSVRNELINLRLQVPLFASWRGQDLRRVCERYSNILLWISWWDCYNIRCSDLLMTLPGIQANVISVLDSGDWRSFSQASTALELDLDELISILE